MGHYFLKKRIFTRFLADTSGAVSIEYAIIASLISIAAIGSMLAIGGSVTAYFTSIQTAFR